MSNVGQREIATQRRVIGLFRDTLGYRFLGNRKDRPDNSNVELELLRAWLIGQGHSETIVERVVRQLHQARSLGGGRTLYDANRDVYELLRYGVKVQPDVGEPHITVWLVDWKNVERNDFAIAEEVTVAGTNTKRPDIVLYVNGIAWGVLELKRSTIAVGEGIRQNLDNQKKEFIRPFFATVQLVMAGNDTEGLRYGVTETREKYYLEWKEASEIALPLDRGLVQMCAKPRLLELVHDFMVFDAGTKKTCRHNQYFGVRAAREHIQRREGGIVWHTQGSGKSLTMVWLAKWIREHVLDARVLIITDRTELDDQIEGVFKGVSEDIYRTKSAADLVRVLQGGEEWLICSLVHKFGKSEEGDFEGFIDDIERNVGRTFHARGNIFVLVDECHRTQSGKLHQAMKALLPHAMLIGFTGTPLLKRDKQTSIEIFGPYIHTYKYDEAVRDGVVLDLRYEARDIEQRLASPDRVDQWFESKTRALTPFAKELIKRRWATMQRVLSAQERLGKIVADILFDMDTRDRLMDGRGNAILVSDSIYAACRFYDLFGRTDLAGKCAIITSYKPSPADIKGEESGEGMTERLLQYDVYRRMLAAFFDQDEDTAMYRVEEFEKLVKKRFIEQPGQMRLLIVVDKLLTGFDAPSATYLYIDKAMRDHGLFQAICRVNRLDDEGKDYGYIIDYKDLFRSLDKAITEYTGEALDGYDRADVAGLLQDRLHKGRERLDDAREAIAALCEPVQPPRDTPDYLRYFGALSSDDPNVLRDAEPRRVKLYALAAGLLRAYANIANEMADAGYHTDEARAIKAEVEHYERVRQEVKIASGDYVDMKMFEPAMRHLLDNFIRADDSEKVADFDNLSLIEMIVQRGEAALDALPPGIRNNPDAMTEVIANNVRRVITDEMSVNPAYYEAMSALLDALLHERQQGAIEYRAYLAQLIDLSRRVSSPQAEPSYPVSIGTPILRALYDNLKQHATSLQENGVPYAGVLPDDPAARLAVRVDAAIRDVRRANWRGHTMKEREVRNAIRSVLDDNELAQRIFEIVRSQRDD